MLSKSVILRMVVSGKILLLFFFNPPPFFFFLSKGIQHSLDSYEVNDVSPAGALGVLGRTMSGKCLR